MKKVYLKFIALFLTMVLSVSVTTFPVKAVDSENNLGENETTKTIQNVEIETDTQFSDSSGDLKNQRSNRDLTQDTPSEESSEVGRGRNGNENSQGILNYIYVEKPYLETPDEQNIVVSWGDGTQNITDMRVKYQKSDGSSADLLLTEKTGELFLFRNSFSEKETGVYQVVQIVYVCDGIEKTLDLLSIGAGAKFGVNMPYAEEDEDEGLTVQSEDVEMSVVTLDGEETSIEAAESIEETIKETVEVAEEAESGSRKRKMARASSDGSLVVVLDPGHGGTDSGAVGYGLREKDLTLKIAKYCKEELEKYRNVKVYMTRTGDTTEKSLERRVQIAANYGADVLVSIHINSAESSAANGAEVWYPHSGYNYEIYQEGSHLAQQIQDQLVSLGLHDRKIKVRYGDEKYPDGSTSDYYGIIRYSKLNNIPGIIVEHAFISNSSDVTNFLGNEEGLKKLGIADATGIANAYGLRKKSEAAIEIRNANDFNGSFDLKVDTSLPEISRVTAVVWRDEENSTKKEYNMQLQADGTYLCKVQKGDFSNKVGKYNAKATIYYKNGAKESEIVSYTLMDSKADISIKTADDEKTVEIVASINKKPQSLSGLKVAVWGSVNGGNDLKWYGLSEDSQGKWKVTIPISNHKEAGEYFADVYADLSNGDGICINSSKFKISEPEFETSIGKYNENNGTFEIVAKNIKAPSGAKSVRFPVWNEADSSTMFWYDAQKQSDGSYKALVNIKNHKFSKGKYRAHVYVTMGNDVTVSKNVGTCEVVVPKANIEVKDVSGDEKTFQAIAKNLDTFGDVKQVRYAVWSKVGKGQDLKWYDASKDGEGTWKAKITVSNHKQAGEYFVDTYIVLKNGQSVWISTNYFTVTNPTLDIEVGKYDENSGTFEIVAHNIKSVSGVNRVQFPVWSKEDNNIVYWYEGVKQSDGSYKAKVNVKNHNFKKGTYLAHVYVTMGNDVTVSRNAGTCEVTRPKANIEVKDISGIEKTYQAIGKNMGIFGSVKQVCYAVWSVKGKGADLKWYEASEDGQGVWKANIATKNHGQVGEYIMDTYVTLINGVSIYVNTSYFTVTDPTLDIEFGKYNESNGAFEIVAYNIQSVSGVERVRFPVWNKADGNTVYWYDGIKQSDGSYKAIANVKNHKYSKGTYVAHVYVTMGNGITVSKNAGVCEVTTPKADVVIKDKNETQKVFQAIGKNLGVFGDIKEVRYAVWSKAGNGKDLKWYSGLKDSQGIWKADIAVSNHKQAGEYIVDTYVTLMNGVSICVNSNTSAFVVSVPTMDIEISEFDEDSGTFEITAQNIISPSGVKNVRFPVWNEKDSSTMYWYDGEKQTDGSYKAVVNVRNHKYSKGTYIIHGYIYAENGVTTSILAGKKEVDKVTIKELYSIMGSSTVTINQMVKQFSVHNSIYPQNELGGRGKAENIVEFCTIAYEEAEAEGVKAEVLFAQMMLETNYLRFGGDVQISQFNFGGLGATGGGVAGNVFPDVRTGIRAQVQHLKCYASDEPLNQDKVDQRWFESLRLKAPYVQWLGIPDNPYGTGWAASKGYGDSILNIINQMKN